MAYIYKEKGAQFGIAMIVINVESRQIVYMRPKKNSIKVRMVQLALYLLVEI